VRVADRTFTTYRLQISQPIAVARITELQLQQLQHLWQSLAYMQSTWHTIAILPVPPFGPICPSDTDDICDNSHILILIILIGFLIAVALCIPSGQKR
jgi:hypothetical protein